MNISHPFHPLNPANPASPLNPMHQSHTSTNTSTVTEPLTNTEIGICIGIFILALGFIVWLVKEF